MSNVSIVWISVTVGQLTCWSLWSFAWEKMHSTPFPHLMGPTKSEKQGITRGITKSEKQKKTEMSNKLKTKFKTKCFDNNF